MHIRHTHTHSQSRTHTQIHATMQQLCCVLMTNIQLQKRRKSHNRHYHLYTVILAHYSHFVRFGFGILAHTYSGADAMRSTIFETQVINEDEFVVESTMERPRPPLPTSDAVWFLCVVRSFSTRVLRVWSTPFVPFSKQKLSKTKI